MTLRRPVQCYRLKHATFSGDANTEVCAARKAAGLEAIGRPINMAANGATLLRPPNQEQDLWFVNLVGDDRLLQSAFALHKTELSVN